MRIKRYQVGGGMAYLPSTTPGGRAVGSAASSNSKDDDGKSKVPGFTKEIISIVKENGIDNDVSLFLNQVGRILNVANDPTGENLSLKEILKVQNLANKVKVNYARYQEAVESLNKEDAWGEMATDKRGYLYVQDAETGELKLVGHKEYRENKDNYIALTNAELLNLRRLDPSLAYRTDMLDNIDSSVGMKTIVDYAKGLIKEFGTTSITGYSKKQADKIKAGLEHIVAGDLGDFRHILEQAPDGIYKITSKAAVSDTTDGIKAALDYLVSTLPRAYQNTLSAKAAVEGFSTDAMLMRMMYINTDRELTPQFDEHASKAAGLIGADGTKAKLDDKDNLAIRFAAGKGTRTTAVISPKPEYKSDRAYMAFHAVEGGRPVDWNNKPLEQNNIKDLFTQTYQLAGFDLNSMSFGNQSITPEEAASLVWDGSTSLKRVELPKKVAPNGQIVPDFSLMVQLNELNKMIADNPGVTELEINQYLSRLEDPSGIERDPNNPMQFRIRPERVGFFATLGAIGSEDLLDLADESEPFVEKMTRDRGRNIKGLFNNLVQYGKPTHSRKEAKKNSFEDSESGDFFYGNVYVYLADPMQAVNVTKDQNYPKETFTNVNEKYIIGQQIQGANQEST